MTHLEDFSKCFVGKGLDVSKEPFLKLTDCDVMHKYVIPNNLYSLKPFACFESLDFIYSKNVINMTKFYPILIKEWFNFCKVGGTIIIEIVSNDILNFNQLIKNCNLFLNGKIKLVEKNYDCSKNEGILIIKKIKYSLKEGDFMDSWTFGIITD